MFRGTSSWQIVSVYFYPGIDLPFRCTGKGQSFIIECGMHWATPCQTFFPPRMSRRENNLIPHADQELLQHTWAMMLIYYQIISALNFSRVIHRMINKHAKKPWYCTYTCLLPVCVPTFRSISVCLSVCLCVSLIKQQYMNCGSGTWNTWQIPSLYIFYW